MVEFGGTEHDPRCPVRLDGQGYSAPSAELLGDLAESLAQGRRLLEQIAVHVRTLEEDTVRGETAANSAAQAVEVRRSLGLPVGHLEAALQAAVGEFRHGLELSAVNPLDAAATLEAAAEMLVVLEAKIDAGNSVTRQLRGPVSELGAQLKKVLAQLERQGSIDEPGFAPSGVLDAAAESVDFILGLVNQGEDEQAGRELANVQGQLRELQLRLLALSEADTLIPLIVTEMSVRKEDFKANGLKVRMAIQKSSPEVQQAQAENLSQIANYQNKMSKIARIVTQIETSVQDGKKLAAMAELIRTFQPFMEGVELLDGMIQTVGVQGTTPTRPLPEAWLKSSAAQWDPGDFGVQRRATGRF